MNLTEADTRPAWCPGCGNYPLLKTLDQSLEAAGVVFGDAHPVACSVAAVPAGCWRFMILLTGCGSVNVFSLRWLCVGDAAGERYNARVLLRYGYAQRQSHFGVDGGDVGMDGLQSGT